MVLEKDNLSAHRNHAMSISTRIALLSWAVAMVTLFFFVIFTIPGQKKIFVNNLASKANGLAVSLHDVAASAAVNEDYSSVVSAAQTLLQGDPDLDFLIVMKNDGFALVVEQKTWQVTDLKDPCWLKETRITSWGIETVPMFTRRLFHFAQPFDYSGIQWGWIHVGLSLKEYDNSVAHMYQSTGFLALACILLSLLGSFFYARQLVRPMLRLQSVVRQIAQGNLSVRADMERRDELGSLASSVNTMAEALLRRNLILESVRFAAYQFLQEQTWEQTIGHVLEKIGLAADLSRVVLHRVSMDSNGELFSNRSYQWTAKGVEVLPCHDLPQSSLYFKEKNISHWAQVLGDNQILMRSLDDCTDAEYEVINSRGIQSFIAIPVFVENSWWGSVVLEDSLHQRHWTIAETSSFSALADMLGATIARQRFQKALIDAKTTLEDQVALRTRELRDQVKVKEKALSDLSSAQSSLVEMSRAAGMAEVATGVLHNVGNVLNSINVSATLLKDTLRESRVGNVSKIAAMMDLSPEELTRFLTRDQQGSRIPAYLSALGGNLLDEHDKLLSEAESLAQRIEHVKEIVAMQQNYGRVSGVSETISLQRLMEDALMLNEKGLIRHHVSVERAYEELPPVTVDKHKMLQILLNLINNAKYACSESGKEERTVLLKIYKGEGNTVCMAVVDNGIGIAPDHLTRIFQHGFTTRKTGHGFGLHSGALAAQELGGRLSVESEGPGKGASFILTLPESGGKKLQKEMYPADITLTDEDSSIPPRIKGALG